MIEPHRDLFLETATVIDGIDREIEEANERKKEIYADVKDEVSPEDFKALKEAIKLRRKRRIDKDACERHDERVWAILNMLEATEQPRTRETPPRATVVSLNGHPEGTAHTRAHPHVAHEQELPEHDPETGELIETRFASQPEPGSNADLACGDPSPTLGERDLGEAGTAQVAAPQSEQEPRRTAIYLPDIPDIPACLDRRIRAEAAE
jgi:uncharacterized protein (UPF0335 family)